MQDQLTTNNPPIRKGLDNIASTPEILCTNYGPICKQLLTPATRKPNSSLLWIPRVLGCNPSRASAILYENVRNFRKKSRHKNVATDFLLEDRNQTSFRKDVC